MQLIQFQFPSIILGHSCFQSSVSHHRILSRRQIENRCSQTLFLHYKCFLFYKGGISNVNKVFFLKGGEERFCLGIRLVTILAAIVSFFPGIWHTETESPQFWNTHSEILFISENNRDG